MPKRLPWLLTQPASGHKGSAPSPLVPWQVGPPNTLLGTSRKQGKGNCLLPNLDPRSANGLCGRLIMEGTF